MPNGGPNCTYCNYNKPFREWQRLKMAGQTEEDFEDHRRRTSHLAYCLVHDQPIANPYWTCCNYGHDGWSDLIPNPDDSSGSVDFQGQELEVRPGDQIEAVASGTCVSHPDRKAQLRLQSSLDGQHLFCSADCYQTWLHRWYSRSSPHSTG